MPYIPLPVPEPSAERLTETNAWWTVLGAVTADRFVHALVVEVRHELGDGWQERTVAFAKKDDHQVPASMGHREPVIVSFAERAGCRRLYISIYADEQEAASKLHEHLPTNRSAYFSTARVEITAERRETFSTWTAEIREARQVTAGKGARSQWTIAHWAVRVGNAVIEAVGEVRVVKVPRLLAGPAMTGGSTGANGTLCVVSGDGHLYAIDANTGESCWQTRAMANVELVATKRRVCIAEQTGAIRMLDTETGKQIWDAFVEQQPWPLRASTAAELLLVATSNEGDTAVLAFNAAAGHSRWRFPTARAITAWAVTPLGVLVSAEALLLLDLASGAERWRLPVEMPVSKIAVVDGTLVADLLGTGILALDVLSGQPTWRVDGWPRWFTLDAACGAVILDAGVQGNIRALDARTGETRWTTNVGGSDIAGLTSGPVLVVGGNDSLTGLDTESGATVWRQTLGTHVDVKIADEGQIYVSTGVPYTIGAPGDTALHAVDAASGRSLWSIATSGFVAVRSLDGGAVYLAERAQLTAIEKGSGTELWHLELEDPKQRTLLTLPDLACRAQVGTDVDEPVGFVNESIGNRVSNDLAKWAAERALEAMRRTCIQFLATVSTATDASEVTMNMRANSSALTPAGDDENGSTADAVGFEEIAAGYIGEEDEVDEYAEISCPFCGRSSDDECEHCVGQWDDAMNRGSGVEIADVYFEVLDALEQLEDDEIDYWKLDKAGIENDAKALIHVLLDGDERIYLEFLEDRFGVVGSSRMWEGSCISGVWHAHFHPSPPQLYERLGAVQGQALGWIREERIRQQRGTDQEEREG